MFVALPVIEAPWTAASFERTAEQTPVTLNVPRLMPTSTEVSATDVSVRYTAPDEETLNGNVDAPFTVSVPANVSVTDEGGMGVGVVGELSPQADMDSAAATSAANVNRLIGLLEALTIMGVSRAARQPFLLDAGIARRPSCPAARDARGLLVDWHECRSTSRRRSSACVTAIRRCSSTRSSSMSQAVD